MRVMIALARVIMRGNMEVRAAIRKMDDDVYFVKSLSKNVFYRLLKFSNGEWSCNCKGHFFSYKDCVHIELMKSV